MGLIGSTCTAFTLRLLLASWNTAAPQGLTLRVNLGSTWGQLGVSLGSTWGQPGVNLGSTCRASHWFPVAAHLVHFGLRDASVGSEATRFRPVMNYV